MGSRSRSSTTSQTTNNQEIETTNIDESINADGGIAARGDVNITDGGAVEQSLDFANDFGQQALSTAVEGLKIGAQVNASAIDSVNETTSRAISTLGGAITKAADASRSDTSETLRRLGLYAAIAVGLYAVASAMRKS